MPVIPQNYKLKPFARKLRNNTTKQENHLWYDYLKSCSFHFYRQKVIGNYIVDFYCPKAKLVVELDGSQHYEDDGYHYDTARTAYLNQLGIFVLRFSNLDINNRFESVCEMIDIAVRDRV